MKASIRIAKPMRIQTGQATAGTIQARNTSKVMMSRMASLLPLFLSIGVFLPVGSGLTLKCFNALTELPVVPIKLPADAGQLLLTAKQVSHNV